MRDRMMALCLTWVVGSCGGRAVAMYEDGDSVYVAPAELCERPAAPENQGLSTPTWSWKGGIARGMAHYYDPGHFAVVSGNAALADIHYSLQLPPLPVAEGQPIAVERCGAAGWKGLYANAVVIRDDSGSILAVGGSGAESLDASCIPAEIKVARVDGKCAAKAMESFEWVGPCGPRRNIGLRFAADSSVTLWSGQAGVVRIGNREFDVVNVYSFDTESWDECGGHPYYAGYVVLRK